MDEHIAAQSHSQSRGMENQGEIRRITLVGLFINIFIFILKFIVGVMGSSQAVVADAVHSLSDTATDIAILVGVKYWSAPADECHPYGHRRIEALITVGIGVVLVVVALGIGYNAIATVRDEHLKQPGWIAFIGAIISILLKEGMYRWTITIGKLAGSSAVLANAWHHRSDALSSIPAALAVVVAISSPKWSFVDHIGALVVSLFILHATWGIMKPAFVELSDGGASAHICALIYEVAQGTDDLETVHAIRTRRMGFGLFVDLHITVDGQMSVSKGHAISEAVKQRIQETVPEVIDVVVHLEPSEYSISDE